MKTDLDELLRCVITPREEPGDILNRKIMEQVKEKENMRQKKYRKVSAAVIAAALVAASSITVFAAWQYLSSADVADKLGEEGVAKAFTQQAEDTDKTIEGTKKSQVEGESQSFGGYKVTMLGLVSGKDLTERKRISNGEVRDDRPYCAVAIAKEDGTAMDAEQGNYFVSPLIGGLNPGLYNAATLCGNYSEFVENGVLYRLLECDNIECFADRKLYLCITDNAFYDSLCYHYNETDGSISRNTEYKGLNALFELKVDASLADPVKAQALIEEIDSKLSGNGEEEEIVDVPQPAKEAMEWARELTSENIADYCVRLEHTVQTVSVDKDGNYVIPPYHVNKEETDTAGGTATFNAKYYNSESYAVGVPHINGYSSSEDGMKDLVITTFTLNEDGTMTYAAWVPKDISKYLQ